MVVYFSFHSFVPEGYGAEALLHLRKGLSGPVSLECGAAVAKSSGYVLYLSGATSHVALVGVRWHVLVSLCRVDGL